MAATHVESASFKKKVLPFDSFLRHQCTKSPATFSWHLKTKDLRRAEQSRMSEEERNRRGAWNRVGDGSWLSMTLQTEGDITDQMTRVPSAGFLKDYTAFQNKTPFSPENANAATSEFRSCGDETCPGKRPFEQGESLSRTSIIIGGRTSWRLAWENRRRAKGRKGRKSETHIPRAVTAMMLQLIRS